MDDIENRCRELGIQCQRTTIKLLGSIISHSDTEVRHFAEQKFALEQKRILHLLSHNRMRKQYAIQLLVKDVVPALTYLAQTIEPDLLLSAAIAFDTSVQKAFCSINNINLSTLPAHKKDQLPLKWKDGGFGLRRCAQVSPCAYFANLYNIIDDLIRSDSKAGLEYVKQNLLSHSGLELVLRPS